MLRKNDKRALRRAILAYLKYTQCLVVQISDRIVLVNSEKKISPCMINALVQGNAAFSEPATWPLALTADQMRRWLARFARHQAEQNTITAPELAKITEALAKERITPKELAHCLHQARVQRKLHEHSGRYHLAFGLELLSHHLLEPHIGLGLGAAFQHLQAVNPTTTGWQYTTLKAVLSQSL